METVDIIQVYTDDYEAIYFNGKMVFADSYVDMYSLFSILRGKTVGFFKCYYIDAQLFEDEYEWDMPVNFEDWNMEHLE